MTTRATIHVPAMDCSEELVVIERGLESTAGLIALEADFVGRRVHVEFDAAQVSAAAIAARIREIGFPAELRLRVIEPPRAAVASVRRSTILAGVLLAAALAGSWFASVERIAWWTAVGSAAISGVSVAKAGWRAARQGVIDMNTLMTLAGVGAIAIGDSYEAATALFLFNIALWLEQFSLGRARRAVETLAQFQPVVAHRIAAGSTAVEEIEPAAISIDDRLLVKSAERFPVDGIVEEGRSAVNQAPITGESLPVDKLAGDTVFAGSLNGDGTLTIRATQSAEGSTMAHIARLVEQAQASRSPTQRFVDRFARRYTPAVIFVALVVMLVGRYWLQLTWLDSIHRGLVLLVIACPCALVISTPVTILCGLHRAARRGVLIKGGEHLEAAGLVTSIAFDKTGTLTTGELRVVGVRGEGGKEGSREQGVGSREEGTGNEAIQDGCPVAECSDAPEHSTISKETVLLLAASLERHSQHPLARAVVNEARRVDLKLLDASNVVSKQGLGIVGEIDGQRVAVGSKRFLVDQGIESLTDDKLAGLNRAATQVWLAMNGKACGAIELADTLRPDAAVAVDELRRLSVRQLTLLTGDRDEVARSIVGPLRLDSIQSDLLPADKLAAIEQFKANNKHLAMIGDGINDAPALAAAPLGIAFGSGASATALEAADVVVVSPQLTRVAELIRLGQRCRRLLAQNIALAIGIKVITLVAAALGAATMWMAVAADVGASLIVIFNGMRLLEGEEGLETRG